MVRLYLFGDLTLEINEGAATLPTSRRARQLLAMLAVERRTHGRSELAGRLWPDFREDSARASLRNALAQLRGALGAAADQVLAAERAEGVVLAAGVWTDLGEVVRLMREGQPESALDRCTGQLLAGFDDDWVQQQRDELQDLLVAGLDSAATAAEEAGDLDAAVRLSRRMTTLDPLAETLHRELIRRLAAIGDRGAALAAYERLRERLATELQVAPSPTTRELASALRRGGPASGPPVLASETGEPIAEAHKVRYARSGEAAIAYRRFGDGPGDLLVVPGWVSNLDAIWDFPPLGPMLARLGELANCVIFDKRGTGLSERDLGFGSLEERADDIRAVMDAAGLLRTSLFAYSESAALAIMFAASYPARVERLMLYSSYARLLAAPDYEAGLPPDLVNAFVERIGRDWGAGKISRLSFQVTPEAEGVEQILGRWERSVCTPTMAGDIIGRNADIDVRPLLSTLEVPTLVLHSSGDPIAPPALGRYVADGIPGARYLEHDADYHFPWDGGSAWFLEPIKEFLSGEATDAGANERILSTILCAPKLPAASTAEDRVRRSGGRVIPGTDSELIAIFDSPSRALACAESMRALDRLPDAQIGCGLHTGEIERSAGGIAGTAVDIARGVAALAPPGEILVSRTVRDLTVGSGLRFTERGRRTIEGTPGEWEVFAHTPPG